uniref:DUF4005 domain-containing protein n=1 Tax=Oryza meridionalis TaxID=40149 RepID=A0A0E0FDX8_9ORYZ
MAHCSAACSLLLQHCSGLQEMGKAGRWLRSFLTGGKKDRKGKDGGQPLPPSPAPPSAKEKRRWSFRRPPAQATTSTSSLCFSDVQQHDQLAAGDVAEENEAAAAVRIQAAFRSYLARKALCALRGMVKLQAMVRGQLVRRQASTTLRRMQALVAAQRRARAERLRLLDEDKDKHARSPRPPTTTSRRSSPLHHRSRKPLEVVDRGSEENVRVVEVDNGGGAARGCGRRSTCGAAAAAAKGEIYQKVSPTPSALTDASARTMSGRLDDYSFSAAASEASGRHHRVPAAAVAGGDHAAALQQLFPKNYMSNTESSRAKARSQSAPRQRHDQPSAAASPSPSPSCGEWTTTPGDRRRRASLDPRDLAAPAAAGVGARMERCASQARASASASAACPWAVRMDRSTASLAGGSDCGSSATTAVTAAAAARVTS